jgi:hypothetical protein
MCGVGVWEVRKTPRRPFDRNARISGSEWAETEERAAGITWSKREMAIDQEPHLFSGKNIANVDKKGIGKNSEGAK